MKDFFVSAEANHIKKEREKARKLKKTRWWLQKIQAGKCYHCREKFPAKDLTMDHLTPLARGGRTGKNNVVVACKGCNNKKSYTTLVGFKLKKP